MRPAQAIAAMLLMAAAALGGVRAADPGLDVLPPPGPPVLPAVPAIDAFVLDNGLRIVVAQRPGLPLVTAQLLLAAGADTDPPGRAGLAALTLAAATRGARRSGRAVDAAALAQQAEALGSPLLAQADPALARLSMTVMTAQLPAALALLADVAQAPLLTADALARVRAQALDAWQVGQAQPGTLALRVARRVHGGPGPAGASPTPASLQRVTAADLRAFHQRHWQPSRAVLVLAGDVDPAQARQLVRPGFARWSAAGRHSADAPASPASHESAGKPQDLWIDLPDSGQSAVAVTAPWPAPGGPVDEAAAAELAQAVVGGGYSSRLNRAVRIERGLSYGAFGSTVAGAGSGLWLAMAQTDHRHAAEVASLMREAALTVARVPVAPDELAARKAALIGGLQRQQQTTAGLAEVLATQVAWQRPPEALAAWRAALDAVTPAQLQAAAARQWPADRLHVIVVGDARAGAVPAPGGPPALRLRAATLDRDDTLPAGR